MKKSLNLISWGIIISFDFSHLQLLHTIKFLFDEKKINQLLRYRVTKNPAVPELFNHFSKSSKHFPSPNVK